MTSLAHRIIRKWAFGAGLLWGSRSSVVRALTTKVGGLGFDSQWLPMHFCLQYVSILIYHQLLTTSSYHQLLLISIVTKIIMYMYTCQRWRNGIQSCLHIHNVFCTCRVITTDTKEKTKKKKKKTEKRKKKKCAPEETKRSPVDVLFSDGVPASLLVIAEMKERADKLDACEQCILY